MGVQKIKKFAKKLPVPHDNTYVGRKQAKASYEAGRMVIMRKEITRIATVFTLAAACFATSMSADAKSTIQRDGGSCVYSQSFRGCFDDDDFDFGEEEYCFDSVDEGSCYDYDGDEDEDIPAVPIGADDIKVTPAKKRLRAGSVFYIKITPADPEEWEWLTDEEFNELTEESVDSITYRSSNTSVASVDKISGKVKCHRKGSAIIKTSVNFANGDSRTYKTKVYVSR